MVMNEFQARHLKNEFTNLQIVFYSTIILLFFTARGVFFVDKIGHLTVFVLFFKVKELFKRNKPNNKKISHDRKINMHD